LGDSGIFLEDASRIWRHNCGTLLLLP